MNIGEKELLYDVSVVTHLSKSAEFPLLNFNVKSENSLWKPYIIKEIKGVKIAVTGFALSKPTPRLSWADIYPIADELKKLLPEMKKKSDLVILMSRMEHEDSIRLIKKIPGIDVVILGKSNREGAKIDDTILAGVDLRAQFIGGLTIQWNKKNRSIDGFESFHIGLDDKIKSDQAMNDLIKKYHDMVSDKIVRNKKNKVIDNLKNMTPEDFMKNYENQQKKLQQSESAKCIPDPGEQVRHKN
ncbi:MAG: hypothetical protein GY749_44005 [Desulfobacteraceae bacterium]|nr:hypothetical protein [Desulfobacteraceae bacterium]